MYKYFPKYILSKIDLELSSSLLEEVSLAYLSSFSSSLFVEGEFLKLPKTLNGGRQSQQSRTRNLNTRNHSFSMRNTFYP